MKKIALITPMLQPYRITFYEKLSKLEKNCEWMIFYGGKKKDDGKPGYAGETTFNAIGFQLHKYKLGPYTFRYNKGLLNAIRKYNPDLIILQSISGNISNRAVVNWASRNHKKIIYWSCGWEPGYAKGVLFKIKYLFAKPFFRKADFHLTYSTTASTYTENLGIDNSIIRTCYNGIEIDHILAKENQILGDSETIQKKYNLNNHVTFLYVGALVKPKRLDLLLDAFETICHKHNNVKLMIIGDGPEKSFLLSRIENSNIEKNIIYLGRIVENVDAYFAAADCLVLPGIGGLALNQAMLQRKTCIVSEADGTENDLIFEGKTGFRFMKDDVNTLIEAMEKRILLPSDKISTMGEEARNLIIKRSNVNSMVSTFQTTIKELLP